MRVTLGKARKSTGNMPRTQGLSALCVLFQLFLLTFSDAGATNAAMSTNLRLALGCACGGLLGNAFLHLLPEVRAVAPLGCLCL